MARDLVSSLTVPILLGHPSRGPIIGVRIETLGGCARSDCIERLGSYPRRAPETKVPETTGILHGDAKATAMPERVIDKGGPLYQKS
jgi:hypothetical protein